jgi:hypothetical protein
MPRFIFKPQDSKKKKLPDETRVVGLEKFTLLNPSIDAGAGRARQVIFAISEFFSYLINQTEYKKGEVQFRKTLTKQEKKLVEKQKQTIEEQGEIIKRIANLLNQEGETGALEKTAILFKQNKDLTKIADLTTNLGELNSLAATLVSNLEKLRSASAILGHTAFDSKNAFREGVIESYAFILKQLKVNYGIEWQQWEIIAAKLAGLTGIITPNTLIAIDAQDEDHQARTLDKLKPKVVDEGDKSLQIASQRLKGYYDLSSFLLKIVNQFPHELLKAEDIEKYHELREQILLIQAQDDSKTAENKKHKAALYLEIYQLLPTELKDQIDEMRVVSSWIGNWDMFNWDLDNCGFCVRHNQDGAVSIEPAMVDFGNSLFNGFGGVYKHLAQDKVNQPAKTKTIKPQDFDPEISDPDQVIEGLIGFEKAGSVDLLLDRFPRRLPFQDLFRAENNHLVKFLSDSKDFDIEQISQGTLRGLYRVSLVSDQAIENMVKKWYIFEGEELFNQIKENVQDQDFRAKLSPDYLIELMQDRRDDFVEKFRPLIRRYEAHYEMDAIATKHEVEAAAIDISSTKPRSFTTEIFSAQRLCEPQLAMYQ